MKLLGKTKNGNYMIYMFDDGTKIRKNNLDYFDPEKPESFDLLITKSCDIGCQFCHEDAKKDGHHGDIMGLKFIETLLPYTEIALGGGNCLEHPDLVPFLQKCKQLHLIPSMTVHQFHFMSPKYSALIDRLINEKLIYGLGVSLVSATPAFIEKVQKYSNAVVHIINGVQSLEEVKKLYDKNVKVLILGYKDFRRGVTYHTEKVDTLKNEYYLELPEMVKHLEVTSFDNLALAQLDVKRLMPEEDWNTFYMGQDGTMTMYVDAVNKQFATCSISTRRYELSDDIKPMFDIIRAEKKNRL